VITGVDGKSTARFENVTQAISNAVPIDIEVFYLYTKDYGSVCASVII
jgi:hypothetical protein